MNTIDPSAPIALRGIVNALHASCGKTVLHPHEAASRRLGWSPTFIVNGLGFIKENLDATETFTSARD